MDAIKVKNLRKCYGEKVAVNDVTFSIKEGELFGLLGVNGAGKSTIIKLLSCLINPTTGEAYIFDKSVGEDSYEVKQIINVSPQETAVAPNLSVKENLEFIADVYDVKNPKEKVEEILKTFKLENVKNSRTKTLSGGYMRRLSIAMALISEPKVLFLDEPTLGLDVIARRELWNVIESLKGKVTIILTTHYMEEAENLCDRIAIMKEGNVMTIDTAKKIIEKTKTKTFEEAFVKIVSEVA